MLTGLGADSLPWARAARLLGFFTNGRDFVGEGVQSAIEVAQRIATRLGMRQTVSTGLGAAFERWDGKGLPRGLRGDAIPLAARITYASTCIEVFLQLEGAEAARRVVLSRRETAFDGAVVDAFGRLVARPMFWEPLASESILEAVLAHKPGPPAPPATPAALEATALAFADFVDLKSPNFTGHARRVATLAHELGRRARYLAGDLVAFRRAALMHTAGYVAIPSFTMNRPPHARSAVLFALEHGLLER